MEYLIIGLLTAVSLLSIGCIYLASVVNKIQTQVGVLDEWRRGRPSFEQAVNDYRVAGGLVHADGIVLRGLGRFLGAEQYFTEAVPEQHGWRKVKKSKKVKP